MDESPQGRYIVSICRTKSAVAEGVPCKAGLFFATLNKCEDYDEHLLATYKTHPPPLPNIQKQPSVLEMTCSKSLHVRILTKYHYLRGLDRVWRYLLTFYPLMQSDLSYFAYLKSGAF